MKRIATGILLLTLILSVACSKPSVTTPTSSTTTSVPVTQTTTPTTTTTTAEPGNYEVHIFWGMIYQPDSITVPVGSTVTIIMFNGQDPSHPVNFNFKIATSTTIGSDVYLTATFNTPGLYTYFCTEHGNPGYIRVV